MASLKLTLAVHTVTSVVKVFSSFDDGNAARCDAFAGVVEWWFTAADVEGAAAGDMGVR